MRFLIADPLAEVDPLTAEVCKHYGLNGATLPLWVDDLIILALTPVVALFKLVTCHKAQFH
ncbi:hypothetical protein CYG49_03970 [Candidatus Saccharibacteria bacterium]|nr:MAG: hypothetical protein CYG49_03970 [Candidatus Saccharibacteria bacterium]